MVQTAWKVVVGMVLVAVAAATLGTGVAFAGENTGNGGKIEINANSECAFSGLDETAAHPGGDDPDDFLVSQSFGQGVRLDGAPPMGRAVPSFACNGHISPLHGE